MRTRFQRRLLGLLVFGGLAAGVIIVMGLGFQASSVLDFRDTLDLRVVPAGQRLRLSGGMTHSGAAVRGVRTVVSRDRLYVLVFIGPVTAQHRGGTFEATIALSPLIREVWLGEPVGQRTIGTLWKWRIAIPAFNRSTQGQAAKVWPE